MIFSKLAGQKLLVSEPSPLQCINIVCINTVVEYLFNACIFGSTLNTLYVFIVCLKLSVVKGFVADLPITFETENT